MHVVREARRQLLLAIGAAWLFVFARSAVFIFYQQALFDSDQAIVGLMAKHLIEGRAFPLFFYGQTYLLGVEAWVASLFFLIGGPTVATLHVSQMVWSLAAATLLIICLVRWGGLRPFQALAVSVFFTIAPPFTSVLLIEANGCNIEPFFYIPLLWLLRDRPLWFGTTLGIGFLNREFTIFAVPALMAVQFATGALFTRERARTWLFAAVAFFAVTQTVEALKPYADLFGPGTRGQLAHGSAGSVVNNLSDRMAIQPADLPRRAWLMATDFFPRQIGARVIDSTTAPQGRDWLWWPIGATLLLAAARLVALCWTRRSGEFSAFRTAAFGWYLTVVGVASAVTYILSRPSEYGLIDRYMVLTIYGPVGLLGAFLALEPRPWLRRGVVGVLVMWTTLSVVDHQRLFARYWRSGGPDEAQQLADGLAARGVSVAAAGYWRAYKLTFLARERVKIASTDVNRIDEYAELAHQQGGRLVVLQEQPCASDLAPIGGWYLCRWGGQ
jgi:hypothetical protein